MAHARRDRWGGNVLRVLVGLVKRAFVLGDDKESAGEPVEVNLPALAEATTIEAIVATTTVDLTATSTKSAEDAGETR